MPVPQQQQLIRSWFDAHNDRRRCFYTQSVCV
jgi:hypothetical protein